MISLTTASDISFSVLRRVLALEGGHRSTMMMVSYDDEEMESKRRGLTSAKKYSFKGTDMDNAKSKVTGTLQIVPL